MNKRPTIDELMRLVNCSKYPERWKSFYDSVMDDYEKNGCIYATPEYYEALDAKYGMFPNFLDDFRTAALEMAKNDSLCRTFALLCEAMKDRESFAKEYADIDPPKTADGSYRIEYEMLTGLAAVSLADYTYSLLESRKLPEEQKLYAMRLFEDMVKTYKARNEGRAGAMSFICCSPNLPQRRQSLKMRTEIRLLSLWMSTFTARGIFSDARALKTRTALFMPISWRTTPHLSVTLTEGTVLFQRKRSCLTKKSGKRLSRAVRPLSRFTFPQAAE